MHHISHIHNNCKSKPKDNGPKTWKHLVFSSRMSYGNLDKWVKLSKSRYWSVTCNRENSKEFLTNSTQSCSNKLCSWNTTLTSSSSCNYSKETF
jgi:hypothetical protein